MAVAAKSPCLQSDIRAVIVTAKSTVYIVSTLNAIDRRVLLSQLSKLKRAMIGSISKVKIEHVVGYRSIASTARSDKMELVFRPSTE